MKVLCLDKDLVEKDVKEAQKADQNLDKSKAHETEDSDDCAENDDLDTDSVKSNSVKNTQSADSKEAEHKIKETVSETSINYKPDFRGS